MITSPEPTVGALEASLVMGAIWATWPALPDQRRLERERVRRNLWVSTLSASVILTWVFNSTNGSVLMTTLLHGTQSAMARPGLLSDRPGGRPAVM